jgi:uncharacterized protein (DUF2141 family)
MSHRFRTCYVALLLLCAAKPLHGAELTLTIANISGSEGQIMIAVLGSEAAFNGDEPPAAQIILPARAPDISVTTDALEPGRYAIRVMHDRNGNGELDTNLVGMPTEPWGFSKDARGSFGPPSWRAASFELQDASTQQITLER